MSMLDHCILFKLFKLEYVVIVLFVFGEFFKITVYYTYKDIIFKIRNLLLLSIFRYSALRLGEYFNRRDEFLSLQCLCE